MGRKRKRIAKTSGNSTSQVERLIPAEGIEQSILLIRGQRVILASDLARLYGVPVKRLNEQVKRNQDRFPEDFVFRLTRAERDEVVANCDHLSNLNFVASGR